ncbi:hypothetical protein A3D77_02640 [Candidatus Gottesmanbacteria bacterium RIFCSPHIGHO2_02_FULL_39_11]|uniref:LytR/CpsA/Psr regulator C-terminal domain-containing protein n=1 Tax=Candidatus Gottesmanbacteria bacterium RIFCSPHIGHO2_02_FULL_39_11 TaxID=1798382 RepID=A0A1F5ZSW9_9BACT|nr:MAG: hypothetical protein A3D77_02640 [Candidatus Gottesmanbacteria bacterium RIFCSPHIGHO2_02_FULL_39_11]
MKSKQVRKKRTARLIRLILTSFFVILFIIVTGIILFLSFSPSSWDGKRRFTIIVQDDSPTSEDRQNPIGLFSIEPAQNRAVYFILPGNTLLNVPYGYGSYPARSIYALGLLDKNHEAGEMVAKAVQSTLGVFIDGYIINKGKAPLTPHTEEEIVSFKKKTFSLLTAIIHFPSFLRNNSSVLDTNLSLLEQNMLFWRVRSLRADQIKFVNLEDSFIITEDKFPDGQAVKTIDRDLFELLVSGLFQDSVIRSENLSVEVVNAAGVEKLASSMSLIFEHLGANVISMTTSKNDQTKACLMICDRKELYGFKTVQLFTRLFKCDIQQKTDQDLQGDVRIILGKDFIK